MGAQPFPCHESRDEAALFTRRGQTGITRPFFRVPQPASTTTVAGWYPFCKRGKEEQ